MKTCVIFNPTARGEKARHFREQIAALSTECSLKPTCAAGAGRTLAAEAVREGFEVIVAAGGDGTVNEVINGIGDEPDGLARVRLGVLPLGTVNVFAQELNLPARFEPAWQVIRQGRELAIDLAEVEFSVDGQPRRRCFAQMAGAGLDARAVQLVDWEQKKRFGRWAYVLAMLKALNRPQPQIAVTDGTVTLVGQAVLLGNGRYYGGKYRVFPLADWRDGLLEVAVLPRSDWFALLRVGWGLLTDQLHSAGGVRHVRAASVHLYSATPVPFHVEGEHVGQLPVKFSVRPRALRVVVP